MSYHVRRPEARSTCNGLVIVTNDVILLVIITREVGIAIYGRQLISEGEEIKVAIVLV